MPENFISFDLLAMGPAIFGAGVLSRLKSPILGAVLLMLVFLPSIVFAFFYAYLRTHAQGDMATAPVLVLAVAGLMLTMIAASLGKYLSKGFGLLALAVMSGVPIAVTVASYPGLQWTIRDSRNLPTREDLERIAREDRQAERQADERRRQDLAFWKQRLSQCRTTLSARSGRTAAIADHNSGKRQLLVLTQLAQEAVSWTSPGTDWSAGIRGGAGFTPPHADIVERTGGTSIRFALAPPPFDLWSDPWGERMFPELPVLITACDAAVRSYAEAYNRKMLALARAGPSR